MLTVSYAERDQWALDIKARREKLKWSQVDLARAAEVSIAAVQKIEGATAGGRSMYAHLIAILKKKGQK